MALHAGRGGQEEDRDEGDVIVVVVVGLRLAASRNETVTGLVAVVSPQPSLNI